MKIPRQPEQLMEELNRYLPADIGVLELTRAPERFHSRLSASGKLYRYQIWMEGKADVFSRRFFYPLGNRLNREAMEEAAGLLIGERDFKSFCGNRNMKKSTVRQLRRIDIRRSGGERRWRLTMRETAFSSRWSAFLPEP